MDLIRTFNYKTRVFSLIMVFTWLVAFVTFGIIYFREQEVKAQILDSQLQIYNSHLLNALRNGEEAGIEYVNAQLGNDSIRFTILNDSGVVIFDTHGITPGTDHSDRREVVEAQNSGHGFTLRRQSSSDNNSYFYSAQKGGGYIVRTAKAYDAPLINSLQGETVYLWTILIISILFSILAFFASRRFGDNINRLRDFAIKAERGEDPEFDEMQFANDELGEISSNIIRLYKARQKAASQRDKYYQNLIEEEHEKSRLKHQLTNNINHELKTPVHAIQGCLETVLSNRDRLTKEQILDFADKSYGQIKRLCALLNDISVITRLTDAPQQIKLEQVDLVDIIGDVCEEMSLYPESQQMRLNINLAVSMPIEGNYSLLKSIFSNLVSNSVTYSGGRDIFITSHNEADDKYTIVVADNGIGVDESHYDKIFERFYRIDQGRSRRNGGTGLGLSIVKNSVIFHGGTIEARQRQGGGLEFVFTLSKQNNQSLTN